MATSSRYAGPAAEGSRVVTVAKQMERGPLSSASAEGIGRSYPLGITLPPEVNKAWHGVSLHEPVWGECSHGIALGAELRKE